MDIGRPSPNCIALHEILLQELNEFIDQKTMSYPEVAGVLSLLSHQVKAQWLKEYWNE